MKKFRFTFTVEEVLTEYDVWPNGTPPTDPSAVDAYTEFMSQCGRDVLSGMENWDFTDVDLIVSEEENGSNS